MFFLFRKHSFTLVFFLVLSTLPSGLWAAPALMQSKLRRIVIDPGHGGAAAGAVGHSGAREKDVVLAVALELGKLIEQQLPDVQVFFTRTSDVEVDLAQRGKLANRHKADLFLSIHANSNKSRSEGASGTETYVMGLDKSESNLAVARTENAAILTESDYSSKYEGYNPNAPESFIIFSLLQNAYMDQSITLASYIEDQYVANRRKSRGVKQGPFLVLWRTGMPSVLTEIGFISNPQEEAYMTSTKGQRDIALNLLGAIKEYKRLIEGTHNERQRVESVRDSGESSPKVKPTNVPEKQSTTVEKLSHADVKQTASASAPKFGIQIASSPTKMNPKKDFPAFDDVYCVVKDGVYKYCTGTFERKQDAQKELPQIRKKIKGAFVIEVSR